MQVQDQPQDTMRAILASAHGDDIDSLLSMRNDYPKPIRKEGEVLIKVCACALAPGDVRVLAGHCDYWQEPPNGFPYVAGGDVSGTVVETGENSRFKVGDTVMAMFESPRPLNGLAEYIAAKEKLVEIAPNRVPLAWASTLPSSALCAMNATKKYVKPGMRVLVLGGAGGGTFFIQMAKAQGLASFVAVTSTADKEWLMSLGADKVINYHEENWWEDEDLLCAEPFDLIVDLAVGRKAWMEAKRSKLLGRHGTFLSVTMDDPLMEIHNIRQTFSAMLPGMWRMMWTGLWPCSPRYVWCTDALEIKNGRLREVAQLIDNGIKISLDQASPLPFSEEGVKRGFHIMQKRHAHGKVVISIEE